MSTRPSWSDVEPVHFTPERNKTHGRRPPRWIRRTLHHLSLSMDAVSPDATDAKRLGATWGFTWPFEPIRRFWRIAISFRTRQVRLPPPPPRKSCCFTKMQASVFAWCLISVFQVPLNHRDSRIHARIPHPRIEREGRARCTPRCQCAAAGPWVRGSCHGRAIWRPPCGTIRSR